VPLLSGLLDQLGHQQADVLGMSWGGGLAQQFAVRCSTRPRMVPVWFHWTGDQFVLGSPPKTPKLKALAEDPRVAPGRGNSPQIASRSPESGDDFSPSWW